MAPLMQVPFDTRGNLINYVYRGWDQQKRSQTHRLETRDGVWEDLEIVWRDNVPFEDTLTFVGDWSRGRSSVNFMLTSTKTGGTLPAFIVDFAEMVQHMNHGVITGTFVVAKRGQNYGIKLCPPSSKGTSCA